MTLPNLIWPYVISAHLSHPHGTLSSPSLTSAVRPLVIFADLVEPQLNSYDLSGLILTLVTSAELCDLSQPPVIRILDPVWIHVENFWILDHGLQCGRSVSWSGSRMWNFCYGSRSRLNFDMDPDPGKTIRIWIQAKLYGSGSSKKGLKQERIKYHENI